MLLFFMKHRHLPLTIVATINLKLSQKNIGQSGLTKWSNIFSRLLKIFLPIWSDHFGHHKNFEILQRWVVLSFNIRRQLVNTHHKTEISEKLIKRDNLIQCSFNICFPCVWTQQNFIIGGTKKPNAPAQATLCHIFDSYHYGIAKQYRTISKRDISSKAKV